MKRFWYFAVLLALILVVSACNKQAQPESPAAHVLVSAVTGEAQLQHANGGEKQPLTAGQMLAESDIISSGAGALIVITLEEGKEIHIGENTIFALSAIRRDATGNVNILALKQGSIVNIVDTPLAESDVYEVHTPRLVMSVRGTSNYMESNERGDTVIGITGETHVFSDQGAANVVPGMKAEMNRNTASPKLSPLASRALPRLAANYAKGREISYGAITQDDIAQSQRGAEDHRPSTQFSNDFSDRLFKDDSVSIPDSGNSGSASASSVSSASDSSTESASSVSEPEADSESSAAVIPPVTETAVSSAAPVQPAPVAQVPSSSTASSSSKAESSSSTSSGSRNNDSYISDSSSNRSSGSRDSSSSRSSSSSAPAPSISSIPSPSSSQSPSSSESSSSSEDSSSSDPSDPITITVKYRDCFTGSILDSQEIELDCDGIFELNKDDLTQLQTEANWYLSSSVDGSSHLGDNGNIFPIVVNDGDIVDVYVFESQASAIVLAFYTQAGGYQGATHLQIPFSSLFTADGVNLSTAAIAVQNVLDAYGGTIVGGQITLDMLYLFNKTDEPAGFEIAHAAGNSFSLWVQVTSYTVP